MKNKIKIKTSKPSKYKLKNWMTNLKMLNNNLDRKKARLTSRDKRKIINRVIKINKETMILI